MLKVKKMSATAAIPSRGSERAIGLDLYADLFGSETVNLALIDKSSPCLRVYPRDRLSIPTNIAVAIPDGYYGRIAPRSGLALKSGIDVLGGVIDSDYRGELRVMLYNTSEELFIVTHGMRIAQLILERADILPVLEVTDLDDTNRGSNGFGSSGV